MIKQLLAGITFTVLILTSPVQASDHVINPSTYVTETVRINGLVEHKLALDVESLRQFALKQSEQLPMASKVNANSEKFKNLTGVLLRDILKKASIISTSHNDVKKMVVIAKASDGYKVVFSWTEIFNSPTGDGVIIFFERNGLPLNDQEGRIAMLSTMDIKMGPRHVKWLQEIEVKRITE